jgi:hypothetical protein
MGGDDRFYNNLFVGDGAAATGGGEIDSNPLRFGGYGLWVYNHRDYPLQTGGNVYFAGARAYFQEEGALNLSGANPKPEVVEDGDRVYLQLEMPAEVRTAATRLVDTELLGMAKIPNLGYENADGSRLVIDRDYFGKARKATAPFA